MNSLSIIEKPILADLDEFKRLFAASLSTSNPLLNRVIEHIRQRSGKMMRPMLVLLSARMYGAVCPATLYTAVALELLHNASLVHDDVVDESSERRGQLSVNAAYNNKVAVLTGDYLLASSLAQVSLTRHHNIVDVVASLGQELAEGELLQLSNISNLDFSEQVYFDVISKKTAALFAACTKAGALSVDTSDENVEKARLLGEYIGLCFQIKDDIFDYYDNLSIGKPTGNDMREGKLTLPALYALNATGDARAAEWARKVKNGTATADEIASEPNTEAEPVLPEENTDRPTLLLIDDNTELLYIMRELFKDSYGVLTAADGGQAWEQLTAHTVDVIICDVMLPDVSGWELCSRMKADLRFNHIPVIILTAKNGADDQVTSYNVGAEGYIAKPFDMKVLSARIDNLIKASRRRQAAFRKEKNVSLEDLAYPSADRQFLQAVIESIEAHLEQSEFDLDQLSKEVNMSKSTLYRKIKSMTGLTPLDFVRNVKMKRACMMLSSHSVTISEVAYAVGFNNPKYFTKCFKEEFGVTPTEYQQMQPS